MRLNLRKNEGGFTLVELLVVISIIGVLATIGGLVFFGAIGESRDTKRIEDIRVINTAIQRHVARSGGELPFIDADKDGSYDAQGGPSSCIAVSSLWSNLSGSSGTSAPDAPGANEEYYYAYLDDKYVLIATLEDQENAQLSSSSEDDGNATGVPLGIVATSTGYLEAHYDANFKDRGQHCNCADNTPGANSGDPPTAYHNKYCLKGEI